MTEVYKILASISLIFAVTTAGYQGSHPNANWTGWVIGASAMLSCQFLVASAKRAK